MYQNRFKPYEKHIKTVFKTVSNSIKTISSLIKQYQNRIQPYQNHIEPYQAASKPHQNKTISKSYRSMTPSNHIDQNRYCEWWPPLHVLYLRSSPCRWSAWASWRRWRCSAHTAPPCAWHTPTSLLDTPSLQSAPPLATHTGMHTSVKNMKDNQAQQHL